MALNQIPVLPEDYPLFDWTDYQSSRDALVQGTPTVQFAKAAWNALVDDLADALAEAGLEWDETYTTAEGARMTDTDGQLTAAKFNSVRLNIDHPAPLGWVWAIKPDFRGYLGREEVRGAATHRRRCDVVYPEYIIELARKLNVLLEIMRGTGLIAEVAVAHNSTTIFEPDVACQPAAHIEVGHNSVTHVRPDIACQPAAHIELGQVSKTNISAEAAAQPAASVEAAVSMSSQIRAEAAAGAAAPVEMQPYLAKSLVSVDMDAIDISRVAKASAKVLVQSAVSVEMGSGAAVAAGAAVSTHSMVTAEMDQAEPLPLAGEALSISAVSVEADIRPAKPMHATVLVGTTVAAAASIIRPAQMDVQIPAATLVSCRLDTAWYPPKWINGGLWIRQSHNVTQNENGELVIT